MDGAKADEAKAGSKIVKKWNSKAFVIPILTVSGLRNSYDSSQNRDNKCFWISFFNNPWASFSLVSFSPIHTFALS